MEQLGLYIAILGAASAVIFAGIGSAVGVSIAGQAAAGVLSESPDKFSKVFPLQALPGTQGIYGFVIAFLLFIMKLNIFGGLIDVSVQQGLAYMAACLPIAIGGLVSGIYQGKSAAAGINMIAKRPEMSGKAMVMTIFVETYALLPFLISIFALIFINF